MEPEELAGWNRLNLQVAASTRAARPCEDCPLTFAAEMRAAGRCNGEPGCIVDEQSLQGVRSADQEPGTPSRFSIARREPLGKDA